MLPTPPSMLFMPSWCAVTYDGATVAPGNAYAYIISPKHGEVVSNPVKVVFRLLGMGGSASRVGGRGHGSSSFVD